MEAHAPPKLRVPFVWVLAFAGGCTDALTYLLLGQVFTTNMTGATVLLGMSIGQWRLLAALGNLVALAFYCTGAALAATIHPRGRADAHGARAVLMAEAIILIVAAALWAWHAHAPFPHAALLLIALTALGMGMQSQAVRQFAPLGMTTTYMTGLLTTLSAAAATVLRGLLKGRPRAARVGAVRSGLGPLAVTWIVYLIGAAAGGLLSMHAASFAFLIPACLVTIIAFICAS
jgi:uncharacterized membrane protein YoaK (UPF0700 family)